MGRKALCLSNKIFDMLTVNDRNYSHGNKNSYWNCDCSCGNKIVVTGINLKSGNSTSCGCTQRTAGDKSETPNYAVWSSMLRRCENKKHRVYAKYGGRGIKVCDRWKESYLNFLEDMGECPKDHSLDRIDNDKGYYPENCA